MEGLQDLGPVVYKHCTNTKSFQHLSLFTVTEVYRILCAFAHKLCRYLIDKSTMFRDDIVIIYHFWENNPNTVKVELI